jgi:hypothetical protein
MKTIWKYNLGGKPTNKVFTIQMPKEAEFLSVQIQNNIPVFWALVYTENEKTDYEFALIATGCNILIPTSIYIGTFSYGAEIYHLFKI